MKVLGEQSAECISKVLSSASHGITTTPPALLEKSGSVAAMLEHNLPVICVARSWQPKRIKNRSLSFGLSVYQNGNLVSILKNKPSISANTVSEVALQLTKHF